MSKKDKAAATARPMQTIVINNRKGGVGKTMLATHLTWFLAEEGARVLFVDLDAQGNGSRTLSGEGRGGLASDLFDPEATFNLAGAAGITVLTSDERLDIVELDDVQQMVKAFGAFASLFDYCVIDTPPTWGPLNFAALTVSDHLVAPVEMKDYSLDGVEQLLKTVHAAEQKGRGGRKINFLGLLASRFNSHSPREKENFAEIVRSMGPSIIFNGVIAQRDGYEDAVAGGVPVWTLKKRAAMAAGSEMRYVLTMIRDRVEGRQVKEILP
ncbi:ParA family protein [Sphingobium sp. BHU LFT2]|uniref:ParA family protein n=1 Tax=Sphingobium sp. BHU LFT2 TaxID=2807634 RepID=UPI002034F445|nr:ParA family protein [Sphingobium sp. BHU LFT2]